MPADRFVPHGSDAELRREKARGRELRRTPWWRRRIAAGICHYCGRHVGARALTADHVVPLIRGGKSVRSNMVPACKECNARKQSSLPWEWEDYLRGLGRPAAE
jgi:5-methylcytosine-specific restriction endonuclease McrA